jgi:drug/metabolite transporter (DMT)-like permease
MNPSLRTSLLTGAALIGFSGNSLLCRAALGGGTIDAASFTTIRIVSGAVVLAILARAMLGVSPLRSGGNMRGALALAAYAVCFSFAYLRLQAGSGALILFGAVQITMIGAGFWAGERPNWREWVGFAAAFGGLLALTMPSARAPDPLGAVLMTLAGIAWAAYSLLGRRAKAHPLGVTAQNFLLAIPLALIASAVSHSEQHVTPTGALLAFASGSLASGVGYSLWYAALRGLTSTRAAIVQLSVPVVTAACSTLLLGEQIALRLLLTGAMILGGVGLAVTSRTRAPSATAAR